MTTATVARPNTAQRPQAPNKNAQAPRPIPFPIAAKRKVSLGFTTATVTMSTTGALANLGPIEIPPTGFLRYVNALVVGTTAANAATVAFAADAPFNAVAYLTLTNAAGDTLIVPIDGYMLANIQKYGALEIDPPFCDPRQSPLYKATTGVGAGLGGSFQFSLNIPLEIDPETAFGSVASMASNKSLQLGLQVAPTATVYTTAPTTPPTVQVTGLQYYWSQPKADNGRGTPQATMPDGNNTVMMWRLDTPAVTPGDKTIKFNNVGNVLRFALFDYRTAASARTEADVPALHLFRLNNDEMYYLPDTKWREDMAQGYGYGLNGVANEAANGLDNGIRVFFYPMMSDGRVRCSSPRYQYLPTLDTTLLQYRGSLFGAGIATLKILTCEVKPTSTSSLYQHT